MNKIKNMMNVLGKFDGYVRIYYNSKQHVLVLFIQTKIYSRL